MNSQRASWDPPRNPDDLCIVSVFKSGKTMENYISYIQRACEFLNFNVAVFDEELCTVLKGRAKRTVRVVWCVKMVPLADQEFPMGSKSAVV